MKDKINVAELLKDCPKGMELDCTIFNGKVYFEGIDDNNSAYPIKISVNLVNIEHLDIYGQYNTRDYAKCIIFPKGKTTWEGFKRPFKDGDIVRTKYHGIAILDNRIEEYSEGFRSYCGLFNYGLDVDIVVLPEHLATEEEIQKLFQAIKDNGYKWNPETKTLEKLPKFKVGDRIKLNTCSSIYTITDLLKDKYRATIHSYDLYEIEFERQDAYELVPNKFDISTLVPFESKVLVRHNRDNKWCGSFFSHIDEDFYSHCYKFVTTSGRSYPMCIPYEGNEHLLGKTDDCDEYFEIWK